MKSFFSFITRQHVLVNVLFITCMVVGLFALTDLTMERYPDVQMGKIHITTVLPGASPEEVESLVTDVIEESLEDLENVEFIQGTSYRGRSSIIIKFEDDTDYDALFDELRLKVLGDLNELPTGIDPPVFTKISVNEWLPAVSVNLVGDRSNRALTLMAKEMKLHLERVPGVKEVALSGEYIREFHVTLDPRLLDRYGITFDDVSLALSNANVSVYAGDYENETGEFQLVVDERFRTREDITSTIIRMDGDGSFVTVGDVLYDAHMSYRDPYVISSVNGLDCITLQLKKSENGNVLKIVPQVRQIVERFEPALEKEGVSVILTQDQRIQVNSAISTLGTNLLVGVTLVFFLIWFFMGLRNALLTTVGIPFAFLVTMVFMWVTNNSLNEITLFSFVLMTGVIVDDAIVVVENIYRHLQEGDPIQVAVVEGAAEVALPVLAATSTTVAAFMPMLMMSGSTGEFFAEVPVAVTACIAASLFECLVILPPHFLDWPGARKAQYLARTKHTAKNERGVMRIIRAGTNKIVGFTLNWRFTSLGFVVLAFVVSIAILGLSVSGKMQLIKIKFFPDEYSQYFIDVEGPTTTSIEATSRKLKDLSKFVIAGGPKQMKSTTAMAGLYVNEDYEAIYGSNLGHVAVEMPVKDEQEFPDNPNNDPMQHLQYMRDQLKQFATDGWKIRVRAEPGGPPAGKGVNIRMVGPNPENVLALTEKIRDFLQNNDEITPYLVDFEDNLGSPNRVYRFKVDATRAAEYGITPRQAAGIAGAVLDGRFVGEFRTPDEDLDIRLKVAEPFTEDPEDALSIAVVQHPTGPVRLADLVNVESYKEPNKLFRYQNMRAVTLSSNIRPGAPISTPAIVSKIRDYYQTIKNDYPGAEINFSGEFEATSRSYMSLMYAFGVAVLIIYMILAAQFRSYVQPVIILSAVVFSLIGVIMGKFIFQTVFTVNSFIATVGVTGVVVNDSLVLLDFINRRYREGLSRRDAIREGIRVRLRPILLTTLTTTLGLMPMAIGFPSYSIVWGSMASTFVTGLCTATFLTLFIVPIEWDLVMAMQERYQRLRDKWDKKYHFHEPTNPDE